jgi:predicted DsbA family dithiol-disulfide isomerase
MEKRFMENKTLHIDIISDVVCPWCYVGKRNLEKALASLKTPTKAHVRWHPFQLDPDIPSQGVERLTYFKRKFGGEKAMENIFQHLRSVGRQAGIEFNLEAMPKAINTLNLHVLSHVAAHEGFQHELQETFFRAYFVDGVDLSKEEELARLLAPWGWDQEKIASMLSDASIRQEVLESIRYAQALGVSGVPFFIFNRKYALSGAQPPEVFDEALNETLNASALLGEACDVNDDNC